MLAHGDAQGVVGMGKEHLLGQSRALFAEHDVDLLGIADVGILIFSLGGEIIDGGIGVLSVKILQTVVVGDIQLVPVIQPCAFQLFVVYGEAHGADEMQRSPRGGAGAGDVARILRNFGLMQYDIDVWHTDLRK